MGAIKIGRIRKKQPEKIHWLGLAAILLGSITFIAALYLCIIPQKSEFILGQAIMFEE